MTYPTQCWIVHYDGVYPYHRGLYGPFKDRMSAQAFGRKLPTDNYHDISVSLMTHKGSGMDDNSEVHSETLYDSRSGKWND
jgi:hypothetical protein